MTHNDFKDDDGELLELYTVKRHFMVENEGDGYRCQQSNPNSKAKLADPVDITWNDIYVQLFERLFPIQFIQDVIMPSSNKKLK